jgi:hypothetical protein
MTCDGFRGAALEASLNEHDEMLDLTIEGVRPYGAGDPVAVAIRDGVIEAIVHLAGGQSPAGRVGRPPSGPPHERHVVRLRPPRPVETACIAILSASPRTESELAAALEMVTGRAARALGRPERAVAVGAAAELVVLEAETTTDVRRGLAPRRTTVKGGKVVGGTTTERWARSAGDPQPA